MRLMTRSATGAACTPKTTRAFVATESIALAVVSLVFIGVLLAMSGESRRQGMLNRDLANLRQIGVWTANYANDHEDRYISYTSAPNSIYPDVLATLTQSPLRQAVGQSIDIIRRRSGREEIPVPGGWIPHVIFSHLVLVDYAERALPDATFVSAGDKHRLNWLNDPINKHDQGFWQPYQNPTSGSVQPNHYRWAYSASYEFVPATYDQNQSDWAPSLQRLSQATHFSYNVPNVPLGGMKQSDVTYPGQKVMVHDPGAWHFSKQPKYFMHDTARVVVHLADGSADAKASANANEGWNAIHPSGATSSTIGYSPRPWEPPNTEPGVTEQLIGYYRWTRGGLKGRDFDGPEINTGQK